MSVLRIPLDLVASENIGDQTGSKKTQTVKTVISVSKNGVQTLVVPPIIGRQWSAPTAGSQDNYHHTLKDEA
jgi:hypothetical protein